ncbi:MAG: adenosylcobinamide-phosphate synthase CbiB [Cellvibrionales bacterium]|nr:adenosylcobinamide-phosphate synthase CbiB [Cellvibrionales bacterium]
MNPFCLSVFALLLDCWLKEPKRFHPLIGFGHFAGRLEAVLNCEVDGAFTQSVRGCFALLVCVGLPLGCLSAFIFWIYSLSTPLGWLTEVLMLYSCVGLASLFQHVKAIEAPLSASILGDAANLTRARTALSMIVSRDTRQSNPEQIVVSTMESLLENSLDALFATLFWYWVLGIEGAILHRFVNTLDAMWGYKNQRFLYFGKAAARLDDVLGFIPARLLALSFVICGNSQQALKAWRMQAAECKSPNGGPVMTSGAGALGVQLGGEVVYQGKMAINPPMGFGRRPQVADLQKARHLILQVLALWLVGYLLFAFFII